MQYRNLIGSEIRRRRDQQGWSQEALATKLQPAGWDIDRSGVSKIEGRLMHVSDFQLMYFASLFRIEISEFFPRVGVSEPVYDFLEEAMKRKRLPVPRGPKKKLRPRRPRRN